MPRGPCARGHVWNVLEKERLGVSALSMVGSDSRRGVVGHLVRDYLGLSETFVYTTLQSEFTPIVLARRTLNLEHFRSSRSSS